MFCSSGNLIQLFTATRKLWTTFKDTIFYKCDKIQQFVFYIYFLPLSYYWSAAIQYKLYNRKECAELRWDDSHSKAPENTYPPFSGRQINCLAVRFSRTFWPLGLSVLTRLSRKVWPFHFLTYIAYMRGWGLGEENIHKLLPSLRRKKRSLKFYCLEIHVSYPTSASDPQKYNIYKP